MRPYFQMKNFDQLFEIYICRLRDFASTPGADEELSGALLVSLLDDTTGRPVSRELFSDALTKGYLRQTSAIDDADEGHYAITRKLIDHVNSSADTHEVKPNYRFFKNQLLISLAAVDSKSGSSFYNLKEIADDTGLHYLPGWVTKAAYDFRDSGYITDAFTMGGGEDGGLSAALTGSGLEKAQELTENSGDNDDRENEGSFIAEMLATRKISIPASDREVGRNDNQESWDEAARSLEAVVEEFKKDHPRDNSVAAEKSALLGALAAGQKLLNDTRIDVAIGTTLILEPLKIIAHRYQDQLVGALATTALAAFANLFGIL